MTLSEMRKTLAARELLEDGNPPTIEFLTWIYKRLLYVHKESDLVDYMHALKRKIDLLRKLQETVR